VVIEQNKKLFIFVISAFEIRYKGNTNLIRCILFVIFFLLIVKWLTNKYLDSNKRGENLPEMLKFSLPD
jgi:hypothetical protein